MSLTISRMARSYHTTPDVLLKWGARKFWFQHLMLAWEAHANSEYSKLLMKIK